MKFIEGGLPAKTAIEGAALIAEWSREAIAERGRFDVALAGGESPKPIYEALRARRDVEWRRWEVFFGDERVVSSHDPQSNLLGAEETLLNRVALRPEHIHPMYTLGLDVDQAARDYEQELVSALGSPPVFDLIILGVGRDGHTLSLPPYCGALFEKERFVMALVDPEMDPAVDRITLTPPVVAAARRVLLIASGRAKAPAMMAVLDDPDDRAKVPAQIIRDATGEVTVLVDYELARAIGRA